MHKWTGSRSGFTLIETSALLTIGAFAAAVLVPAISHEQDGSRLLNEKGNLRILAQLVAKYSTDDLDGILGPVHPEAINFIGDGYAEYGGGPGTMPYGDWNQEFDPRTRLLNHYLYDMDPRWNGPGAATEPGDVEFFKEFQCFGQDLGWQEWPRFDSDSLETERPYFKANGAAFRMNNLAYEDGSSVGIYGRSVSQIPVPSITLAFMEARAYQSLWTNDTWGFLQHGELIGNHGKLGFFNVIYADGHADNADFGDGTYYEFQPGFNEKDARGTWGRMDCYPAAEVPF